MEDSQIAALPPELAAEAQNLRRDWETRNRQMQERILTQSFSHALRNPGNRSEFKNLKKIIILINFVDFFRPASLRSPSQSAGIQHHWWSFICSHARTTAERDINNREHGAKRSAAVGSRVTGFNSRAALHRRSKYQHAATLSRHQKPVLPHPDTQVDHQVAVVYHHALQRGIDGTLFGANCEHTKGESTRR